MPAASRIKGRILHIGIQDIGIQTHKDVAMTQIIASKGGAAALSA